MADPAPPPPCASFNSLPVETKAHIVKLAKQQYDNYRARMDKATAKEKSATFFPSSPQQDLRASGCLANSFRFSTLPRNSRHFRRIVLDKNASLDELQSVFSLLLPPSALGITRMSINGAAAVELFGKGSANLFSSALPS